MGVLRWSRAHRTLTAFAAGGLLTLLVLAAIGYFILSDQRRSARVLAAALSQALARDVRIERVTDLGTGRVVMRGVHLPRDGGWPAEVVAERVEATGPLVAAARGDPAPVRLVVTRPTVVVGGGADAGLAVVDSLRQGLESFLNGSILLDVTLTGGTARHGAGATEFDLTLRKGKAEATAELTLRPARGAPLALALQGRVDGPTTRLALTGRGGLASVAGWLPPPSAPLMTAQALDLSLEVDARPGQALAATGTLRIGDVLAAAGTATLANGTLEVALPRAVVDLAFAAGVTGVAWRPAGRAELTDLAASWRPEAGGRPVVRTGVRLPTVRLPAAALGTEVDAEEVDGRLALEPAGAGSVLSGHARATRVRGVGLEAAPAETRYRVTLDGAGAVSRADLTSLVARLEGAAVQGILGYDGRARRVEARLGGEDVDASALVRRLAPGWLAPEDRLRLSGLRVTLTGVNPSTLDGGEARLEARGLRVVRKDGEVSAGRTTARVELTPRGVLLALDAERTVGSLPAFTGMVSQLGGSAELARGSDGGLTPAHAALTARDRQGQELIVASLRRGAAPGRFLLAARAPALERLDGLWPAVTRQVNGSARLDVELAGPGWETADGRLALRVPAAEVAGGKVAVRDLEADVPILRGTEAPREPPWGTLAIGELIAYGVVARDVTTPARIFKDRLSLNDLTYALYAGEGKGWTEIELQAAGLAARGSVIGERVRIEEFISAYGIRGGTMTGLMRYKVDYEYRAGHLGLNGRFEVPDGGTVNIELLDRLLSYAQADPSGIVREALHNLRAFDYKSAEAEVRSAGDDLRVSLSLRGRERLWILPPKVREINIRNMPLSFLARQFPGAK